MVENELEIKKTLLDFEKNCIQIRNPALFNLICYSKNMESSRSLRLLLSEWTTKFPCRIFFIQESENTSNQFTLEILYQDQKNCDLLQINISEDEQKRVPLLILPHLLSDLPVFLLYGEDPTEENPLLSQIAPFCTRLVYGITTNKEIQEYATGLLKLMKEYPNLEFMDLNWINTQGWRKNLSQIFHSQDAFNKLEKTISLQIHYNNTQQSNESIQTNIQASYLINWLASILGWNYLEKKSNNSPLNFFNPKIDQSIVISLIPRNEEEIPLGTIIDFDLSTLDSQFISVSPLGYLEKVVVHISTLNTCDLPFTLPLSSLKKPFPYIKELCYAPVSSSYQPMLLQLATKNL